jgi:hypothetical protein
LRYSEPRKREMQKKIKKLDKEIERLEERVPVENEVKEKSKKAREMMVKAQEALKEVAKEAQELGIDPRWWSESDTSGNDPRFGGGPNFRARAPYYPGDLDRETSFGLPLRKHKHRKW